MNLRDRITKLFKAGIHTGRDPRAGVDVKLMLSRMPGALRASVSKECQQMIRLGLLVGTRVPDWNNGKKYFYSPTPLLLEGGAMPFDASTVTVLLRLPMTVKDLRYAIRSVCGVEVTAGQVQRILLGMGANIVSAPGGSVKYPRFIAAASDSASGVSLAQVARAWARAGATCAVRRSNEQPGRPLPQ